MKKVLLAVMAMMAIGFTSCGNKSQASSEAAGTEVTVNADDEAAATIDALTEQIEAKDANKFQEVLATVQDKIKELLANNPEVAKEYRCTCRCYRQWFKVCRRGYLKCW